MQDPGKTSEEVREYVEVTTQEDKYKRKYGLIHQVPCQASTKVCGFEIRSSESV